MGYLAFEEEGECYLLVDIQAIDRHPVFFANLLSGCLLHDASGRRRDPLDIWQAVSQAAWHELLACHQCMQAPALLQPAMREGVLALKRAVSRKDGICTIFFERNSCLYVQKCTLDQASSQGLNGQPIFPGMTYDLYLRQLAARGDWLAWRNALEEFIAEVFSCYSAGEDSLQGIAIDAIARNAVFDEGAGIAFFDLEFAEYGSLAKTFFIYRLCLSLMSRRAGYLADSGFACLYEVYCYLCSRFLLGSDSYRLDVRREVAFQSWVSGKPAKAPQYFKGLLPFAPDKGLRQRVKRMRYYLQVLSSELPVKSVRLLGKR